MRLSAIISCNLIHAKTPVPETTVGHTRIYHICNHLQKPYSESILPNPRSSFLFCNYPTSCTQQWCLTKSTTSPIMHPVDLTAKPEVRHLPTNLATQKIARRTGATSKDSSTVDKEKSRKKPTVRPITSQKLSLCFL